MCDIMLSKIYSGTWKRRFPVSSVSVLIAGGTSSGGEGFVVSLMPVLRVDTGSGIGIGDVVGVVGVGIGTAAWPSGSSELMETEGLCGLASTGGSATIRASPGNGVVG